MERVRFMNLDSRYQEIKEQGVIYREQLSGLFKRIKFDEDLISRSGVISCDIGLGPEIVAFGSYNPSVFIVAEPPNNDDHYQKGEIDGVLSKFKKDFSNIDLRRDYSFNVLNSVKGKNSQGVGLITRLNVFPEDSAVDCLVGFVEQSSDLLVRHGLVVVSVFEDCDPITERCEQAIAILKDKRCNLALNYIRLVGQSIGSNFVIGKKL